MTSDMKRMSSVDMTVFDSSENILKIHFWSCETNRLKNFDGSQKSVS